MMLPYWPTTESIGLKEYIDVFGGCTVQSDAAHTDNASAVWVETNEH